MPKNTFSDSVSFIQIDSLKEGRFGFIKNEILKEHIAVSAQYITFLYTLEQSYEATGAIQYSIFKTIIVYAASIAEGLLNYKLGELIKKKDIKESDMFDKQKKWANPKFFYKLENDEDEIWIVQKKIQYPELNITHSLLI